MAGRTKPGLQVVTVWVSAETKAALQRLAWRRYRRVSEEVRRLIEAEIEAASGAGTPEAAQERKTAAATAEKGEQHGSPQPFRTGL